MANNQELIKQVAGELGWTQSDVQTALGKYNASTTEEVYACCLRYAGSELKKRNYELGASKRVNNQQKETIKNLVNQLTNIQILYEYKLVPALKNTIDEQANYIKDLLKEMSSVIGK